MLAPYRAALAPYRTRTNLRCSTADGLSCGVMVGLGETYLPAFALAAGLGEVSAGLVASVPLLAGGALQLISPHAVRWAGSEKRWVLACATLQALAFLPLVIAALWGHVSTILLIVIASFYWAGGLASGPAWNTWMESLVPARVRARYFARRTRLSQMATFAGVISGGVVLQAAPAGSHTLLVFATLFLLAGLFRLGSVAALAGQQSPQHVPVARSRGGSSKSAGCPNTGRRLLRYLVVMQGFVQISGPFFVPFMLEQLAFSYSQYVVLIAVAFAAKAVTLSGWAILAQRYGARWLLWVGGVGIIPLSALWIVDQGFLWLVAVQAISGAMWGAYELGFFLMFFETLPIAQRTRMLTRYNFANTCAIFGGSLLGGFLLNWFGAQASTYYFLFALSSMGRAMAVVLLVRIRSERLPAWTIGLRILGVRPNTASLDTPILPSFPDASQPVPVADPQAA